MIKRFTAPAALMGNWLGVQVFEYKSNLFAVQAIAYAGKKLVSICAQPVRELSILELEQGQGMAIDGKVYEFAGDAVNFEPYTPVDYNYAEADRINEYEMWGAAGRPDPRRVL